MDQYQSSADSFSNQPPVQAPRDRHRLKRAILIGVVSLAALWLIAAGIIVWQQIQKNNASPLAKSTTDGNVLTTQEETNIASIAEKVSPSVVSIRTKVSASGDNYWGSSYQEGAGTGIIVSKDGYVLTNKHVISGASQMQVVLSDGTVYDDVSLAGTDPLNDLAFLKIANVSDLPPAELGDSTTIKVGQRVVAIGNSLGQYDNTVTSGIISGTGRPIQAQAGDSVETLTDLIQTDAAINPGNSGGPLLNSKGQVIGINTAIAEGAEGIGFAIPIHAALGILKQAVLGRELERAYLGVRFIPINAELAKKYKLPVKEGAYVFSENNQAAVVTGSPADKAGIKKGDVITEINGKTVGQRGGVSSLIAEYAPGDTIEVKLRRGDETVTVKVTLDTYK
jgi:serine protease Do